MQNYIINTSLVNTLYNTHYTHVCKRVQYVSCAKS